MLEFEKLNGPKTLKFILEKNGIDWEEGDWGDSLVELRQEAIKWAKLLAEQKATIIRETDRILVKDGVNLLQTEQNNGVNGAIMILKIVFNITDEELR